MVIWLPIAFLAVAAMSRVLGLGWFPHPHHRVYWASFLVLVFWGVMATMGVRERRQLAAIAERLRDAPPEIPADVAQLRAQGKKVQAIKRYQQLNPGIDLREARYIVGHVDLLRQ
jgi:hypothetical protein